MRLSPIIVTYCFQNSCSLLGQFAIKLNLWAIKPKGNTMTSYETLFVVKPTLTDEETSAVITKVKDILAKEGAELLATNDMGMRKLAYPVEKHARGYYTVLFFNAEGTVITELERNLRISEDVIKFLTVKYTKVKELAQFNKLVAIENKKSEVVVEAVKETVEEIAPETEVVATETTETTQA